MREIVVSDAAPEWSRRAQDKLAELRAEYRDAGAGSSAIVPDTYVRVAAASSSRNENQEITAS